MFIMQEAKEVERDEVAEFELKDLLGITITLVVVGIVVTYGVQIMSEVQNDINETADPDAHAAAGYGESAVGKIGEKLGTIVTVIMAAVIIGILVKYFYFR